MLTDRKLELQLSFAGHSDRSIARCRIEKIAGSLQLVAHNNLTSIDCDQHGLQHTLVRINFIKSTVGDIRPNSNTIKQFSPRYLLRRVWREQTLVNERAASTDQTSLAIVVLSSVSAIAIECQPTGRCSAAAACANHTDKQRP